MCHDIHVSGDLCFGETTSQRLPEIRNPEFRKSGNSGIPENWKSGITENRESENPEPQKTEIRNSGKLEIRISGNSERRFSLPSGGSSKSKTQAA